jgi:hypothetical protein
MTIERMPNLPGAFVKRGTGARAERIHAHREHSISIVRTGATSVRIAGQTIPLEAGQCVYIPPGIPHLCSPENPALFSYEVIYWTEETVVGADIHVPDFAFAASLTCETSSADTRSRVEVKTWKRENLAAFFSRYSEHPDWTRGPFRSILDGAAKRLIRNPDTDPDESRFRVYRQCRSRYGISPHDVEQIVRVERAKTLLSAGRSVADTAAECGFCDQSHFTRAFRLYTGLAPVEFRHSGRTDPYSVN